MGFKMFINIAGVVFSNSSNLFNAFQTTFLEHLHLKEVNQSFVHIFLTKRHLHHIHKLHQNPLLQSIRKLFLLKL